MCVRRYPGTPVPSYTSCAASLTANQRGSAPAVDRPRRMLENRPAMLPMRSVRSRACRDGGYLGSDRLVGMAATHAGTHSTVSIARTGARGVVSVTVHRCRTHLRLRDARCGAALMGDTDARPEELWRARLGCSAISACAGAIMGALRLMRSSPRAVGRAVRAVLRRASMSDDFDGGDDVRQCETKRQRALTPTPPPTRTALAAMATLVSAVIRAARPTLRNAHDKVAYAVHAAVMTRGWSLVATGAAADAEPARGASVECS